MEFLNHSAMELQMSNIHITRHFERLEKSNEITSELLLKPVNKFSRSFISLWAALYVAVLVSTLSYPSSS